MRHALRVKKRRGRRSLYCKIDILWNVAGHRGNLQRVEFGNHDANIAELRAAGVMTLRGMRRFSTIAVFLRRRDKAFGTRHRSAACWHDCPLERAKMARVRFRRFDLWGVEVVPSKRAL
jgi:hypothetical protein